MYTHDDDCIVALCTPQGRGALGLIRLSGSNVRSIVARCSQLSSKKSILVVPSHTIHHGWVVDIDQVMFIVMDGPRTFTGQDTIEITCHNNPFIINAIIERCIQNGARLAQEGEFSRRAYMNSKIDLLQAEAINELISAQTQQALKKSLAQLEGSFSQWMSGIEHELIKVLAWCNASFEFLDDEAEFGPEIEQRLTKILADLARHKKAFSAQQLIRQGIRIALIGSVNAGKSSLFNALLGQQRAIVTPIEGTTRDVIEASMEYEGMQWTFIDTAGLRKTNDVIEQEGIRRSQEEAAKADIILLVADGSRNLTEQEYKVYQEILKEYPTKTLLIQSKKDQGLQDHPFDQEALAVSIYESMEQLIHALKQKSDVLFATLDSPYLLNKRHHGLLSHLEQKLQALLPFFKKETISYELICAELQDALTVLSELTGKSISQAGLDAVFKEFCVGK